MDPTDEQLHARWLDGDEPAGRALFRRHAGSVLRFFRSKLPSVAEDMTQETFARFLRHREGAQHVRAFLFGIARNLVREEIRRRRPDHDEALVSVVDLGQPASTQLHERQHLLRALQGLPVGQQIAIELHYWEGFSSAELGEALGVSASAARSRLDAARAGLRKSLSKAFAKRPAEEFEDLEHWVLQLRAAFDE